MASARDPWTQDPRAEPPVLPAIDTTDEQVPLPSDGSQANHKGDDDHADD